MGREVCVAPGAVYGRRAELSTMVYSPDDGGWYGQEYGENKTRTTRKIYATRAELEQAIASGKVRWEKWS